MSLIRKSDVKSHLSTTDTSVYPFGLTRSDADAAPDSQPPDAPAEVHDISISPSHPISPEAVPDAQVGGSVGVPANAGQSGKGSW
ncbi:MAG: hypothetical protein WBD46_05135 [Acidobacteriaceae bacterium]